MSTTSWSLFPCSLAIFILFILYLYNFHFSALLVSKISILNQKNINKKVHVKISKLSRTFIFIILSDFFCCISKLHSGSNSDISILPTNRLFFIRVKRCQLGHICYTTMPIIRIAYKITSQLKFKHTKKFQLI